MGLGKPGRLRVDEPTITGELGPAPDAYTHYSPVMIAALSKTAGRSAFDQGGPFFLRQAGGRGGPAVREGSRLKKGLPADPSTGAPGGLAHGAGGS